MTTQPITRIAALLAATTTLVGAFAACGDTNNITNVNCGAGTVLKDGTCVAVTDATTDTGAADTGTEVPDSSGGGDAGPVEEPEDPLPDDPCPVKEGPGHYIFNCDPKCGAVAPECARSFCSTTDVVPELVNVQDFTNTYLNFVPRNITGNGQTFVSKVTIRLPRNLIETHTCFPKMAPDPNENPNAARRSPRPKFMMFVHNAWQNLAPTEFVTVPHARFQFGAYTLQFTHGHRMGKPDKAVHPDVMPMPDNGVFREYRVCADMDEAAISATDKDSDNRYRGFQAAYIFTDRKLRATNVEIEGDQFKYNGYDTRKDGPRCP